MNEYLTLAGLGESLLIEKKSKFIGNCVPVSTKEGALEFIAGIKAKYKDASCNPNAYYIREGNYNHSSDDGEPKGTAGIPILDAIQKAGLVDAVVVVTRYYGGIPLGAGGLVRAFSNTASSALRNAGTAVMTLCVTYEMTVNYPLYDQLVKLLEGLEAKITDTSFTDRVVLRCILVKKKEKEMLRMLTELFRGNSNATLISEEFYPFELITGV